MASLTAAEAREAIPGITGTGHDTAISEIVGRVDALIAAFLGYPPASAGAERTFETATYTLYLHGPRFDDERILALGVWPVQSVTSIYDDPTLAYDADTLVASTDYVLDGIEGLVLLKPTASHGAWSKGRRSIKATVVAGYATVPDAIKESAIREVAHRWRLRSLATATNVAKAGNSIAARRAEPELLPESRVALAGLQHPSVLL